MTKTRGSGELVAKGFGSYLPIIVTGCIICATTVGMVFSCAGIFYAACSEALGVPTSQISLYMTIIFLASAVCSPFMGNLMEKFDLRPILSICVLCVAAGMVIMSTASAAWVFWVGGVVIGIGEGSLVGLAVPVLINRWFKKNNGVLIGICTAFTGVGGVLFNPIGQAIIDAAGWRMGYIVFAIIIVVLALPCTIFAIRSYPADRGMLPYGASEEVAVASSAPVEGVPAKVAMKSPVFWAMCVFAGLVYFMSILAQFFPVYVNALVADGMSVVITGAVLASIAMAGQAVGKVLLGLTGDSSVKKGLFLAVITGIAGIVLCWLFPGTYIMAVGGFIFGFYYAACLVQLPMQTKALFGERDYAPIYSRVCVFNNLFGGIGAFMWGAIVDSSLGFSGAFTLGIVLLVVILVLGLYTLSASKKLREQCAAQEPAGVSES